MSEEHPSQLPKHSDEEIARALEEAGGNISAAARELGYRRTNLKMRIDKSAFLTVVLRDLVEEVLDVAEQNKFNAARAGDQAASSFLLMTLGKNRGYSQRLEATGKDGKALNGPSTLVFRQITDEEIRQIEKERDAAEEEEAGDDVDPDGGRFDHLGYNGV